TIAVVNQPVERRQECRARRHSAIRRIRMRAPPALLATNAEGAPSLFFEGLARLWPRHLLDGRVPGLREGPDSLLALPADGRDEPSAFEQLEHQRDLAAAPPVVRVARDHQVGLDLPGKERTALLQLPQQVPLEARVRLEELGAANLVHLLAAPALHSRDDQGQV